MAEYIEREALLQQLEMAIECKDCPRNADRKTYYDRCACSEIQDICDAITETPKADVQPVKRGKWKQVSTQVDEYNNHLYECTACRAMDRHNINVNVPYCWHCGAKMEE